MSFYITVLLVNLLTKTTFVDDEIELVIQKLKEFDNIKKIAEENYKKYDTTELQKKYLTDWQKQLRKEKQFLA